MKTWGIATILALILLGSWLPVPGDTTEVPLRGTNVSRFDIPGKQPGTFKISTAHPTQLYRHFNSIPTQTNFPAEQEGWVWMGPKPPPIPQGSNRQYHERLSMERVLAHEPTDIIIETRVQPIITLKTNGVWEIRLR